MKNCVKIITLLCLLFTFGIGSVWALESSEVANSAATTVSDGDLFVIAATYSTTTYYLTTTVSSNWGRCTTDLDDATLFTAHGNTSSFYLTCSAGRLVAATSNFSAYDSGTTKNLTLSSSKITNSSSTSFFLDYNHSSGTGGARWYSSNQSAVFYLYKVTITPKTITYNAGSGTCISEEETEESGGAGIVLPSATPSSLCAEDGWVFAGWKKGSAQTTTTSIPDLIPGGKRYYPKKDEELYAVYRKGEYLEIDFESEISSYTDWTFNDIRLNAASPAITAHGGSQYGRNVNASGNGVTSASITSNNKITSPGGCRFYVSKESTNTTSSTWSVETSNDGSTWTSRGSVAAASMDKGEWQVLNVDLSSYSNVYVRISYGSSNAIRAIDDIVLSSATYNSNPDCVYDYFVDIMHDNETIEKQGTYSAPAAPSDATPGATYCDEKHYHFLGWIESQYVDEDGTLNDASKLKAPGDEITADNKTFYAIWSKVE